MIKLLKWIAIIVMLIVCVDIAITLFYPNVSILKRHNPKTTAFMEYRKEQWEKKGRHKTIKHRWVKLKRVSPYLVKAVIISEDDKFWGHDGFDFVAMKKALEKDIAHGKIKAGGSSISQQLAKNLYLSPSKNPIRKIKEAILTWRIERALSKKRIMEIYLNVAEWGDGVFGIEAAARHHYGKRAGSLSAQEAVRLASVLPNTIIYKPNSRSKYVRKRAKTIYRIMVRRGIVIPEYEEVINAPEEKTEETPMDIMTVGPESFMMEGPDETSPEQVPPSAQSVEEASPGAQESENTVVPGGEPPAESVESAPAAEPEPSDDPSPAPSEE